jgi:MFS family permease
MPDSSPRPAPTQLSSLPPAATIARTAGAALFLLTCLNLFNFIDRYVLAGVYPLVQQEFGVNEARMGLLTTAFFFTYMVIAPFTGWLGDRFPRKPLIIAGALLWSVATLLTATVHSYDTLLFRHAIVGIGEATFSIFAPAMLADFYPEIHRNRVLSIFYITIPVGAALGYVAGGVLASQFHNWRAPFYICAAPGVLIAVLFWIFVREPVRGGADRLAPTLDRATLGGLFRNPAYWTATLGMAMLVFSMGGISAFLPKFFVYAGGYSMERAALIVGGITAVDGLLGTVVGGWIAQRWQRHNHRALYLISAWSAMLVIPAGLEAFFGPRSMLVPSALVAEFFLFLNTGPLNTAIVNSVGAQIRATAIAFNLFIIHFLGDFPSPTIIGAVADRSNLRIGLAVTLLSLLIASVILFLGSRFAPLLAESEDVSAGAVN